MSDASGVELDTFGGARPRMRALVDTEGMDTPERARFWLEHVAWMVHRGSRVDTWTSARDEAARFAGISLTMAKRIWQRWEDMHDVSGGVIIKLMVAYERVCEANERAADGDRTERLKMRAIRNATAEKSGVARVGKNAA